MTLFDCGDCPCSGGCLGRCMKSSEPIAEEPDEPDQQQDLFDNGS